MIKTALVNLRSLHEDAALMAKCLGNPPPTLNTETDGEADDEDEDEDSNEEEAEGDEELSRSSWSSLIISSRGSTSKPGYETLKKKLMSPMLPSVNAGQRMGTLCFQHWYATEY